MPMGITTEGLADSRPELRSWRAIMMGPLLMAGAALGRAMLACLRPRLVLLHTSKS